MACRNDSPAYPVICFGHGLFNKLKIDNHFTAPKVSPSTSCFWQNQPMIKMGAMASVDAADSLEDLRIPPGNRLERLSGTRRGQHSIRINDQWRICFRWSRGDAYEVEITDYH